MQLQTERRFSSNENMVQLGFDVRLWLTLPRLKVRSSVSRTRRQFLKKSWRLPTKAFDLLSKAHCVVIVPSVKRGGFVIGAQYGVGVAMCRQPQGSGWTGPSTVRIEGGSIGLQNRR
jgi:lipid-binding SYLF domain-containing protein